MPTTHDHRPDSESEQLHVERNETGTLPRTVLPRTDVPEYLSETPMQEQGRHAQSFHTNHPAAQHAGHSAAFQRPGLEDNLKLIQENLADADYFESRHRVDYETDSAGAAARVTAGTDNGESDYAKR